MRNLMLMLFSILLFSNHMFAQEPTSGKVGAIPIIEKAEAALEKKKYKSARNHLIEAIQVDWELVDDRLTHTKDYFKKLKKKKRHWRKVEKAFANAQIGIDMALRAELLQIEKEDQQYRSLINEFFKKGAFDAPEIKELEQKQDVLDAKNLKRVEEIIAEHGYPSQQLVGKKAGKAVFYVIQHSDQKTQEKYLPIFEAAAEKGDLKKKRLALMTDRVLMAKGRPQIYGTQMKLDKETNQPYVYQILDAKNVNSRRKSIGLSTIEEYIKPYGIEFSPAPQPLSDAAFRKFLGGWELVNIRNAETFEIIFSTEKLLWIEFNKKGRLRYNREVSVCEIPYQAEANGTLRLSQLSSCDNKCCDDKAIKKMLNYHQVNRFEMYDKILFLMDKKNQIWEFKKRGVAKKRMQRN